MNIKFWVGRNQRRFIGFVLFFFIILNLSLFLAGKEHPGCVSATIEGIHFEFCIDKTEVKKNETFAVQVTVNIPENGKIYIVGKEVWYYGCSYSRDEIGFCLGSSQIFGDRVPMFYDLKKISKRGVYRNKKSFKIKDFEDRVKEKGIRINGIINVKFYVSFCREFCDYIKNKILQEEWSHHGDSHEEWYEECYLSIFRNYFYDEVVGTITLQVIE